MNPKGQHTIPRLHLQHFAGANPPGQVWTYDAFGDKAWSAVPEETGKQTHFYSAERDDGTMDASLEKFLAEVEGRAAPVYERLLKGQFPSDPLTHFDFAQFLALMYCRTTAMRRLAGEVRGRGAQIHNYAYAIDPNAFDSLTRRVEAEKGEAIDPIIKEEIRRAMLDPTGYEMLVSKESTFMVLAVSDKLAPVFDKMKWSLGEAVHGYFITSDNPLVREVDPKTRHPIYGDHGFMNKTAEITFPLSPKVMLLLSWDETVRSHGAFERDHVRQLNVIRAAHSDRYLYAHFYDKRIRELAVRYKDSRPSITTEGFGPKKFAPIRVARRFKGN
jgi:hypothetical protein